MQNEHLSLRISTETKARLEELSKATGRSKTFLALDAIEKYLEIESWQIQATRDGIKSLENDKTFTIDEVKKEWNIE